MGKKRHVKMMKKKINRTGRIPHRLNEQNIPIEILERGYDDKRKGKD